MIEQLMLSAMILLIVVEFSLLLMIYSLRQKVVILTEKLQQAINLIFGKANENKEPFLQRMLNWSMKK